MVNVGALLEPMRLLHKSGGNRTLEWRRKQLISMRRMLSNHEDEFLRALQLDLGKAAVEAGSTELALIHKELNFLLSELPSLMKPVRVASPGHLVPCFSHIRHEPLRSPACLVIGPFNYPVQLSLLPAIGSLAGGNPTVIKPSELCRATSSIIAELVPRYFDESAVQVVEGGIQETTALLEQEWGLVFFTGSERVGKIVAGMAARTLTPTVLELGGKSPTYIDRDSPDMRATADRIAWGKTMNSGQTCVAPDYILCHEDVVSKFCKEVTASLERMYTAKPQSSELARIVSSKHAERLVSLIKEVEDDPTKSTKILLGGSKKCNPSSNFVAPTVILDPPVTSMLMKEEIFGPIMPIFSVASDSDAIDFIRRQPGTPLVLYVFTTSKSVFDRFLSSCPSAAAVRNDVVVHFSSAYLPTGGLGSSGYGAYHGRFSFETFTHRRPVLYKPCHRVLDFGGIRYAPYAGLRGRLLLLLMKLPSVPVLLPPSRWRTVGGLCTLAMLALSHVPALRPMRNALLECTADFLDSSSKVLRQKT